MPRVQEIPITGPNALRAQPGWALVPDAAYLDPSKAPLNPSTSIRSKRATRFDATAALSSDALTLKQGRAIQRRIDILNSENKWEKKDVAIAIPQKKDSAKGGPAAWREGKKQTSGVRKILQSERTFRHHLEEEEAFLRQQVEQGGSGITLAVPQVAATYAIPQPTSAKKRKSNMAAAPEGQQDVVMGEAAGLASGHASEFDINPLLTTNPPTLPSQEELQRLMTQPPLSYNAARAAPSPLNAPPQRHFCEICGYWGQVKCLRCGGRVCGWQHKEEHDATCNLYG